MVIQKIRQRGIINKLLLDVIQQLVKLNGLENVSLHLRNLILRQLDCFQNFVHESLVFRTFVVVIV